VTSKILEKGRKKREGKRTRKEAGGATRVGVKEDGSRGKNSIPYLCNSNSEITTGRNKPAK
jgi:hypothetical protein